MVRVFANGSGDLGSIPGQVIPKTQKWYLMPPCLTLSIIRYGSRVKWSNPGEEGVASLTPWCYRYRKTFGSPSTKVANFIWTGLIISFNDILIRAHGLWVHVETNASCCLLQHRQQRFCFSWCIYTQSHA